MPKRSDEPDSRDWIPPDDMRSIFMAIKHARDYRGVDGNADAIERLCDAVEELATYIAGDRGRRDG